jgi:ATP-dependent RNA helicase DeaD
MTKPFTELGLSADLLKAIDRLGFEQASPIQAAAIPLLLSGRDVVGQSQTGSGKTAAFAAPAIEKVDVAQSSTQVLILCPTRELAVQVSEEVHKLAFFKRGLHALPIYGGQSYERQFQGLRQGAQIVIGTPGRVMDHMRRGTLRFDALKIVILDEVDVMLNMGFRDDIELILQATPRERQTVFFSATIPRPIQQLIEKYGRDPQNVRIEQKALTVPTVEQVYYEVDRRFKIDLLTRLIDLHDLKLGIIFCNTKRMVDDLVDHLNAQGYSADRLHGDMSQNMRDRVMNKFRRSGLEFLVATDVAARGIDVDDVEVVFNYDLPYDGEDYVHRIGRTGRKGKEGRAISFASGREVFQIRNIERYTNTRIHRGKPPTVGEVEEARANVFLDKIRATLKSGDFKRQDQLIERLLEEGFSTTDIASALLHQLQSADGTAAAGSRARASERPDRFDERPRGPREERSGAGAGGQSADFSPQYRGERFRAADRRKERPRGDGRAARHADASPASPPHPARETSVRVQPEAPSRVVPGPVKAHGDKILHPRRLSPPVAAAEPERPDKPKHSPRTPANQTRLFMNIGAEMNITPIDIVNRISGETGLPGNVVGRVDIRERHSFVDVATEHVRAVIAKLNRAQLKGHKTKVKVA